MKNLPQTDKMKNIFLLAILFLICASHCHSQNWLWGKSTTGVGNNKCWSVSTDAGGNVYTTGFFTSPTIAFGSITLTNAGSADIFIAKYDSNGNVLWAKSIAGTSGGGEGGCSISVDGSGSVFVTGGFYSPTITFGTTTLTNAGFKNVFIAKCDSGGNVLWAKSAGGTMQDEGLSVSASVGGNVVVSGVFSSPTITFGSITLTNAGIADEFVAKYDANGNVLWAKRSGGIEEDAGCSVSADAYGNVFATGYFYSPTMTFDSITLTNAGIENGFISKYDANGNILWVKSIGGTSTDYGHSVSADASGNVFITGGFNSPTIAFGSTMLTNAGNWNIFVAKYDGNGDLLWAKGAGGTSDDLGNSVSASALGDVFITGRFGSPILTFGSITLVHPMGSTNPMFIVHYDANGNVLCASALASGDLNNGVSADTFGNAYIGGDFQVNPFIVGSDTLTNVGNASIFVAKYQCDSDITTLIDEGISGESISIFPNPSSGIFTADLSNCRDSKICVYNVLGNCLWNKDCRNDAYPKIDLSSQPKGIYFMEIVSDRERAVKKIVLQ